MKKYIYIFGDLKCTSACVLKYNYVVIRKLVTHMTITHNQIYEINYQFEELAIKQKLYIYLNMKSF